MTRGSFIVLEGLDRSGKSTQLDLLLTCLQETHVSTESLHFPDRTTSTGVLIDKYLKRELSLDDWEIHDLYAENRVEKMSHMINLLESGVNIICSRYAFSGIAYSASKNLNFDKCVAADAGILAPDLVLFLAADPDILAERAGYGDERYETRCFQHAVYQNFLKVSELVKSEGIEWKNVDATRPVDEVSQEICLSTISLIKLIEQTNPPLKTMFSAYESLKNKKKL
ncbi:hypothetical protein RCL1_004395 [Eukaryota sp. TZLM3-RCL]